MLRSRRPFLFFSNYSIHENEKKVKFHLQAFFDFRVICFQIPTGGLGCLCIIPKTTRLPLCSLHNALTDGIDKQQMRKKPQKKPVLWNKKFFREFLKNY